MDVWDRIIDYWDREWRGASLNGSCLRDELASHSAPEATDRNTAEGYSVWSVGLHVHRYKELYLSRLEARSPTWPAGDEDFPPVPAGGLGEAHWRGVLATMDVVHGRLSARARLLDRDFLDRPFDGGPLTWAEGLISVFTHDFYHVAQIRNMKR